MAEELNAPPRDPSLGLYLDTKPSPPPDQKLPYERQANGGDEPGPTTPCKEAPLIIAAITCSHIVKTSNCKTAKMCPGEASLKRNAAITLKPARGLGDRAGDAAGT
jgi:hypothetical protein